MPREKVAMERAGREEDWEEMPLEEEEEEGFSGESEVARLAEGVLLCGDAREVEPLLVAPLESFVRRLALLLRWMVVVMSPKVDEMLWREAWCRWWWCRGGDEAAVGTVGSTSLAGAGVAAVEDEVGVLGGLLLRPPKKDGRREKMDMFEFECE